MESSKYPLKRFSYKELQKLNYIRRELINGRIFLKDTLPVLLAIRIGLPIKGKRTMQTLKIKN